MIAPAGKRNVLKKMEAQQIRTRSNLAGPHQITGQFLVEGSGEVTKQIYFPVRFIEKPLFFSGIEMNVDSSPVDQSFPLATTSVYDWDIEEPDLANGGLNFRKYFVGANLAVVCIGNPGQRFWVNWMMVGTAITNPLSGVGDLTTDTIL